MKQLLSRKHAIRNAFFVIILLALFLRIWRLDYGQELPFLAHSDEPLQYNAAVGIIKTGDLNPHYFNYPSFSIYLDTIVLSSGFGIKRLLGIFDSREELERTYVLQLSVGLVGTPSMLLLGRAIRAVVGTLSIGLLFILSSQLTKRKWIPLLAASLLAISSAHIRLSHYMTVDVIATFFAAATVASSTIGLARKSRRFLWIAALCSGLAASSKYNYCVFFFAVAITCWLVSSDGIGARLKRLLLCIIFFCLAFLLTSPFVLIDRASAIDAIRQEIRHYSTGHIGMTGSSFVWYLNYLWKVNFFYILFGIPGMLLLLWKKKKVALPIVLPALLYFILISIQAVHFDRSVLPVLVFLIVGTAALAGFVQEWLLSTNFLQRPAWTRILNPLLHYGIAAILMIPSLAALPSFLQFPSPSGKAMAQSWFARTLETPLGRSSLSRKSEDPLRIAAEGYTVCLDPRVYQVEYLESVSDKQQGLPYFIAQEYDIVVLGSGMFKRYYDNPQLFPRQVRIYQEFFNEVPDRVAFEGKPNPLEFIPGGTHVYIFFLTEKARQLKKEMKSLLAGR